MYLTGSTWRTVHVGSCSALACSPVPDVRRPIAPGAQLAMHSTYGTGALTKTITYKHIRYRTIPDCQGLLQSSCLLSSHKQPSEVSAELRGFACFWIDVGGVPLASIKLHSETNGKEVWALLEPFLLLLQSGQHAQNQPKFSLHAAIAVLQPGKNSDSYHSAFPYFAMLSKNCGVRRLLGLLPPMKFGGLAGQLTAVCLA